MTRRRWLALTTAATGCAPRRSPSSELTLRVGVVQSSQSSGPLFLAVEQGYFREEGLNLEVDRAQVTGLHISALAAGKLDACLVAMSPAIPNAVVQGAPVRLVAARQSASRVCGGWGQIFARLSAFPGGLKDFRELKGKRIAYSSPGSLSDFALDMVLESVALSRADIQAVAIKRQEAILALLAGNLDAVVQSSGTKEIPAERRAGFGFFPGAELIHPTLQTVYIGFGERLRGEKRDAGIRFLRAFRRGSSDFFANRNPAFMRKWTLEMGDPEAPIANCPQEARNDGAVDPASVKVYLDWAVRRKHIEAAVAPETLIDATLMQDLKSRGSA